MTSQISFPVSAVRTITSPSQKDVTTYFVYVNFKNLPANLPLDVNPRKPKMTTQVAKQLIEAVISPETDFDINNRGIVIVAKDLKFYSSKETVTLDLGDDTKEFGILDGGHTYTAIIENRNELNNDIDKFVKLEIIVGENLTTSRIADARNTSNEVSDIALYELDDKFDFVKNAIENESFATDIAYKDNDDKRLPVIELLKLLFSYNTFKYPDGNNVPTQAYSGKAAVFKDVKKDLDSKTEQYANLAKLLPTLVKLYDKIELTFEEKYKLYAPKGRIGRLRGVERGENGKKFKTTFLQNETDIKIANGFILPIFGAFRALIDLDKLEFKTDPIALWDRMGQELVKNTLETTRNPQDAGKSAVLWSGNYRIVLVELLSNM